MFNGQNNFMAEILEIDAIEDAATGNNAMAATDMMLANTFAGGTAMNSNPMSTMLEFDAIQDASMGNTAGAMLDMSLAQNFQNQPRQQGMMFSQQGMGMNNNVLLAAQGKRLFNQAYGVNNGGQQYQQQQYQQQQYQQQQYQQQYQQQQYQQQQYQQQPPQGHHHHHHHEQQQQYPQNQNNQW